MKNKDIFIIFILTIIALVILSGNVNAAENVYIIYGELKNETVELKPFFYLGSGYTEDNSSIESNYSALFYNEINLIKTFNFSIELFEGVDQVFFFSVDIPNSTKVIKFKNQTDIIKIFNISENVPSISELNITNISQDVYNVSWSANDADGDTLTYSMYFSTDNKTTWELLVLDINKTSTVLDFTSFPNGNYSIKLVASDGFNFGEKIHNETLFVPNQVPYIFITSPLPNSVFSNATNISNISFEGWAYDPELGELNDSFSFNWYSSIDGFMGNGSLLVYGNLSVGNHTIILNVTDDVNNTGTDSINITITNETKPEVSIYNITFYPEELVEGENLIIAVLYNIIQDALINISFYDGNPEINGTLIDTFLTYAYANYYTDVYGLWSNSTAGATPFYTNVSNPYNLTLNKDESTLITWYVNATGSVNSAYEFFAYANKTSNMTISNITSSWNVTIV